MIELCKDVDALGINNNNVRSCDFSRSERDTRKQVVFGWFQNLLRHEIHSAPSKFVRAAFSQLVNLRGGATVKHTFCCVERPV